MINFRDVRNIFAVAAASPGFAVDEDIDHFGEELKLPEWFEKERITIEKALPKLIINDPK
jgi:glyoxalase family protein